MKEYRRRFLAYQDMMSSRGIETSRTQTAQPNQANTPRPTLNRKQRRQNAKFNRLLERRLKKDGTPAKVTILPDGGIHAEVDGKKLELSKEEAEQKAMEIRHAENEDPAEEVLLPADEAPTDGDV